MKGSDSFKKFCEINAKYKERLDEELRKKQEEEYKIICEQLDIITKAISESLEKREFQNFVRIELRQAVKAETSRLIEEKGWIFHHQNQGGLVYVIHQDKNALVPIN
jgi:phosphomevalonate kinase